MSDYSISYSISDVISITLSNLKSHKKVPLLAFGNIIIPQGLTVCFKKKEKYLHHFDASTTIAIIIRMSFKIKFEAAP